MDWIVAGLSAVVIALSVLLFLLNQARRAAVLLLEQKESELSAVRERIGVLTERSARAEQLELELSELRAEGTRLSTEVATLKEREAGQTIRFAEQQALLAKARDELSQRFAKTSMESLSASGQQFLSLANETFQKVITSAKGDLDSKREGFELVGKQISTILEQMQQKMNVLEETRREAHGDLSRFLHSVAQSTEKVGIEAGKLHHALTATKSQGRWGELQLRNVVESAGMLEHCDFTEQSSGSDAEGRFKPDLIVRLPNQRVVVVDAKAPLTAYMEGVVAEDNSIKDRMFKDHALAVRQHIKDLAQRDYQSRIEGAVEFALLFLPGESFFYAAMETDPTLLNFAADRKVVLVTPTSLIAFLRAVALGWREVVLQKNAEEVRYLGKELYDRLSRFTDLFSKVGRNLGQTVRQYNLAVGSLERRLLVTARRFQELGATSGAVVEEPALIAEGVQILALDEEPEILDEVRED